MAIIIYVHTHKATGKRYVGQTSQTMQKRWQQHIRQALRFTLKWRSRFHFALKDYGIDGWTNEVIATCDSPREADRLEREWINTFKSDDPRYGFNTQPGNAKNRILDP